MGGAWSIQKEGRARNSSHNCWLGIVWPSKGATNAATGRSRQGQIARSASRPA